MGYAPLRNTPIQPIIILIVLFIADSVLACESCPHILNLEETIQQSDVVIIGKRTDHDPEEQSFGSGFPKRPELIKIQVIRTLKGEPGFSTLNAHSWYGMCPYGIQLKNEEALIFLSKTESNSGNKLLGLDYYFRDRYGSVNNGCAQKSFEVKNNQLEIDGKIITVDGFIERYLPKSKEKQAQ